ncbi:cycloheximide resistance protein [Aspergillus recurvatus]
MPSPFENTPFSDILGCLFIGGGPLRIESPAEPEEGEGKNWSTSRKSFVLFQICLLTLATESVYVGSAIITPAEPVFVEIYDISVQVSTLALSVYVLGYGFGPLLFSPLSEMPRLGRNIPYMTSFFLFLVVTAIASRVSNYPGLVVLRFIQGFLGGPALATGGASLSDVLPFNKVPYGATCWMGATYIAPSLGPILTGFSVPATTWRWSMYELLILSGGIFILLFFCLPETNAETLLLRRAQRLRRNTGRQYRSRTEIKEDKVSLLALAGRYLTTPFRITVQDPSVAFINLYTALAYSVYYTYFEAFPLVYMGTYGLSTGLMGVIFLSIIVASLIGGGIYVVLVWRIYEPYTLKSGIGKPEYRLIPGIFAAAVAPTGLFLFGWTSRESIHWIVPTIGIVLSVIIIYLPTSYPRYAASLFAANGFIRSALACGAIHFSQPLFGNLGIGRGCSVLGGLAAMCFFGIVALWHYGAQLRARSRFAETY